MPEPVTSPDQVQRRAPIQCFLVLVLVNLMWAFQFSGAKIATERLGPIAVALIPLALSTVLFMAGAGGSLRAGVTENPVRLTRSVREALTTVTAGGAPVFVWPGGGITFMVDVTRLPENAFGYVPTPALVAPIEFTLPLGDYVALQGHMDHVRPLASFVNQKGQRQVPNHSDNPWPFGSRQ